MEGKAKVESYLKFSKFFFVELPMAIPKESDAERMRRETMEITDKFSEDSVNLLYPDIEELKRRISQVSTAHNSLLNATSSASVDKDTKNIPNTSDF